MIALVFVWLSIAGAEGLAVEPPPLVGETSDITLTDARERPRVGVTVRVVVRPELDGEKELAVGITDARGRVRWVPEDPGVAEIRADEERMRLSVPWPSAPTGTATLLALLLLAAAGATVFGVSAAGAGRTRRR